MHCFEDRKRITIPTLEGAQAELSWITILRKRKGYKRLCEDFDALETARYDRTKLVILMRDPRLIRNRLSMVNGHTRNCFRHPQVAKLKPGRYQDGL